MFNEHAQNALDLLLFLLKVHLYLEIIICLNNANTHQITRKIFK